MCLLPAFVVIVDHFILGGVLPWEQILRLPLVFKLFFSIAVLRISRWKLRITNVLNSSIGKKKLDISFIIIICVLLIFLKVATRRDFRNFVDGVIDSCAEKRNPNTRAAHRLNRQRKAVL